ncbi:very short patch repair endonuclease [Candidatus Endomicrobiellum trichonymphae]|uniref:very short patch repair endonuclease n=1 Tax=Endomicrobium trichonymphae TaxID=1408204 RepID=UPI001E4D0C96|nr:very short patch repair endonuclease [Candidatus Endomicrobium trichonymphae]
MIFLTKKRSAIMSCVRSSKNNSTELKLISIFKEYAIKDWQRNYKLEGKPDFVFKNGKKVVFTDGCFWHGHKCRNTMPKDNSEYWTAKIIRNKIRDKEVSKILKEKGWQVIRIWECELNNKHRAKLLRKLLPTLQSQPVK